MTQRFHQDHSWEKKKNTSSALNKREVAFLLHLPSTRYIDFPWAPSILVAKERLNGSDVCPQQQICLYINSSPVHSFPGSSLCFCFQMKTGETNSRGEGSCVPAQKLQSCRAAEGSLPRRLWLLCYRKGNSECNIWKILCGYKFSFIWLCVFNSPKQWVRFFKWAPCLQIPVLWWKWLPQ